MTPDAWLILLSTLLALAGYLLWVTQRLPRTRVFIVLLAVVTLVLSIVVHAVIASRQPTSSDADGGRRSNRAAC